MSAQVVDFVVAEPISVAHYSPDKYQLRRDKKLIWLQRLAIWILRKLGAYAVENTLSYKRYRIDTRKVSEAIGKQRSYLFQHYHERGERVLIGAEDFAELMHEEAIMSVFSFSAPYHFGQQIFGMPITVIPWMRGYLVMPKEKGDPERAAR